MFGDIAQYLLKIMGHSGAVPGVILAKDVAVMLERLKKGIESRKSEKISDLFKSTEDGDSDDEAVSLAHRALPLIELLTAAAKENSDVMWDVG
jgi:hypothetical protein